MVILKFRHLHIILLIIITQVLYFQAAAQSYMIGADLSFLKQAEDKGYQFKENNISKAGLDIFRDHGYNWIRLRLFHSPNELPNNLEYTIGFALKAKEKGFSFLLDFHYSDTWADPAKQFLPKAWEGMSHEVLVDSVFDYTRKTIITFGQSGILPDMVQIGNEVISGMLWPDGKLPDNWSQFSELIQAGIDGVNSGCINQVVPKIMIHIDQGGNRGNTKWFFDNLISRGIKFDVIGQSYYPWWHGSLLDLRENLAFMAKEYKKPVVLVEVAYCYVPTEYLSKAPPFTESPEGQKQFLEEVNRIVMETPDNLGAGIFWWEPATMNAPGISTRDFFDDEGNVLPVITVFDKFTRY
jgi:arabinogalactan endo-1,4-beta-galactosidase